MSTEQDLELEALLLAAELEQEVRELELGYAVKGKRRPLAHELRARVRFAELDRDVVDTAAQLERRAATVRDQLIDDLAELGTDADLLDDPVAALARVRELADPTSSASLPRVRELVDEVAAQLEADLTLAAERGAREVLEEARRQGLTDLPRVELDEADRTALRAAARRLAEQPVAHGLAVALEAAERLAPGAEDGAELIFGAIDAVDSSSAASTGDVARQAAAGAQATGRTRAATLAPRPAKVYASELLDGNTCGPCGEVDGRTYRSLEAALEDYPGAGGFVFCAGGLRCRGTLVYVWGDEAAPTVDGTPPPQGPSDPPGGPDGPIRPIPADDRTSFPRPQLPAAEQVAPYALPAQPLPPATPAAVDPATVAPDLELAELGDERLRGAYRTALADGDNTAALRYADELDRRSSLGSAWRDPDAETWAELDLPDLSPEELLEAERLAAEAMDNAGGLDALEEALADRRPGRRIDKVREDYNAEQYRRMMEAEANGAEGLRNDRAAEFARKYGDTGGEVLWFGPARTAYYYASEELRAWWAIHGRESFAEYAVSRGIRDAKTTARAKAAAAAREDAARLAEEAGSARSEERKRQRAAESRKRRATGAGAQLERDRKRMAREQARAERLQRQADRTPTAAPAPRILDDGWQT